MQNKGSLLEVPEDLPEEAAQNENEEAAEEVAKEAEGDADTSVKPAEEAGATVEETTQEAAAGPDAAGPRGSESEESSEVMFDEEGKKNSALKCRYIRKKIRPWSARR